MSHYILYVMANWTFKTLFKWLTCKKCLLWKHNINNKNWDGIVYVYNSLWIFLVSLTTTLMLRKNHVKYLFSLFFLLTLMQTWCQSQTSTVAYMYVRMWIVFTEYRITSNNAVKLSLRMTGNSYIRKDKLFQGNILNWRHPVWKKVRTGVLTLLLN